jgi:hypothetical protein
LEQKEKNKKISIIKEKEESQLMLKDLRESEIKYNVLHKDKKGSEDFFITGTVH